MSVLYECFKDEDIKEETITENIINKLKDFGSAYDFMYFAEGGNLSKGLYQVKVGINNLLIYIS